MDRGHLSSRVFGQNAESAKGALHFVQISDTHMGFSKPANPDVAGTLSATIQKINALPQEPEFIIHTGDLSHSSIPVEFDTLDQILKSARPKQVFFVLGEHDTSTDDGKQYMERYGKQANGSGWYSFNHKDVHFVGLSNVLTLEGLGKLGAEQLAWLETDLKSQPASRPIVVFAHIPLWSVYPDWGWGGVVGDAAIHCYPRRLRALRCRFDSVGATATRRQRSIRQTLRRLPRARSR